MSLISDYETRTAWKYDSVSGRFPTHPGLLDKVDEEGAFRPYMGSTVVFRLDRQSRGYFQIVREIIMGGMKGLLSEPFPASAFHMTLHDLVCPEMTGVSQVYKDEARTGYSPQYMTEVERSLAAASRVVEEIRREYAGDRIELLTDRVVNMVSKSLVMMLKPATEIDYRFLLELYHRFDGVKALPFPLTPHVTLAYYRPGEIDGDLMSEVIEKVQVDANDPMPVSLSIDGLTAQRFLDMAHYTDVPIKVCFCCDGGMNRSIMAAAVLNQRAAERGLPVQAKARAAFPNTEGKLIPSEVKDILERHGISTAGLQEKAKFLKPDDTIVFSQFVAMTGGALMRIGELGEEANEASTLFRDLPDPQYGASYDSVFEIISQRTEQFLDDMEKEMAWSRAMCEDYNGRRGK